MLSLDHLPAPPSVGQITACEIDGLLRSASPAEAISTAKKWLGGQYIDVVIAQEVARPVHSRYEARNAFSIHTETPWQRVMAAYYEDGVEAAVQELSQVEDSSRISLGIHALASVILRCLEFIKHTSAFLLSRHLPVTHQTALNSSGTVGSTSVLKITWHPHTATLAAVFADDTIRVYASGRSLIPLLKHRLQKNITDVAWMPYSASVLGVGCGGGVLLWTLDPVSVVTRPSGSCVAQLSHPSARSVSSFTWHPKGMLLACVGNPGREIVVWDIGMEAPVVVHTGFFSSLCLLRWSPEGSRLLAATVSSAIKVFETHSWSYERWSLESRLQSAVWSQDGYMMLFVSEEEPFLYCINFSEGRGVGGSQVATQVADFSSTLLTTEGGDEVVVGGVVKQLAWDPKSERLAVLFAKSECIALFHTNTQPQLHLAPGGLIRGEPGTSAVSMTFQKNVTNGAVLSVVWYNGQVQHVPLRFASRSTLTSAFSTTKWNPSASHNLTLNSSHSGSLYDQSFTAGAVYSGANVTLGATSPHVASAGQLYTSM